MLEKLFWWTQYRIIDLLLNTTWDYALSLLIRHANYSLIGWIIMSWEEFLENHCTSPLNNKLVTLEIICFGNVWIVGLTSKASRVFLDKNCEKLSLFRAVRKKLFFQHSPVQACTRLLWKVWKKFRNFGHTDWRVITFEVRRFFFKTLLNRANSL